MTAHTKVFLSYSSADAELAQRLAKDLKSAAIDVWIDQWELEVGEKFAHRIESGVDAASFVIVLLTKASVTSEWVAREWRRKADGEAGTKRVQVVPVRGEECEIPDFLAQRSYVNLAGGSYPLGFRQLLEILRHHAESDAIEVPRNTILKQEEYAGQWLPVVTPITLEVSSDLIPLFDQDRRFVDELAPRMRDALRAELGFPLPGIRVRGNETDMPPSHALLMIEEIPEIMFQVGRDEMSVDGSVESLAELGITAEPRLIAELGIQASIAPVDRVRAESAGMATWDAAEYLCRALQFELRRWASLFLDVDVTRKLVDVVARSAPELVAEAIPKAVSWFELTEVLILLVEEDVYIRDMASILEALSHWDSDLRDPVLMAERARQALSAQITARLLQGRESLPVLLVDREIEGLMCSAIQPTPVGSYLSLEPQLLNDITAAVRREVNSLGAEAAEVTILTSACEIRRHLRKCVELEFPSLQVVSRQDLEPEAPIKPIAQISLNVARTRVENGGGTST